MAIKFEKILPGMTLLEIKTERAGNTTMRRIAVRPVAIVEVDTELRRALVRWNGNSPRWWYAHALQRLYAKVPPATQKRIDAQRW